SRKQNQSERQKQIQRQRTRASALREMWRSKQTAGSSLRFLASEGEPQGLKPVIIRISAARLKSCPSRSAAGGNSLRSRGFRNVLGTVGPLLHGNTLCRRGNAVGHHIDLAGSGFDVGGHVEHRGY